MKSLISTLAPALFASDQNSGNGFGLISLLPALVATLALFSIGQLIAIVYLTLRVTSYQHQLRIQEERLAHVSQSAMTRQYFESSLMANAIQHQVEKSIGLLRAELGLKLGPFSGRTGSEDGQEPSISAGIQSGSAALQVRDLTPAMSALRDLIVVRRSQIADDDECLTIAISELPLPDSGPPITIAEIDQLVAILNRELLQTGGPMRQPVKPVTLRHRRSQSGEPNLVVCVPRTVLSAF